METCERLNLLEKELEYAKERIKVLENQDSNHEYLRKFEKITVLEERLFSMYDKMGFLQLHAQKSEQEQEKTKSLFNTIFQDIGKIDRLSHRCSAKIDSVHKKLDEYNEDIMQLHEILTTYKQENVMITDTLKTILQEGIDKKEEISIIRSRIIDVCDNIEKLEHDLNESTQVSRHVYFKLGDYNSSIMTRMNELELSMKSVTMHKLNIQKIIERLVILETNK